MFCQKENFILENKSQYMYTKNKLKSNVIGIAICNENL